MVHLFISKIRILAGKMEEDSKALTAFAVGPLGFYECERMPFGLMNAPVTFQHLLLSCLGNLHLQYCII